MMAKVYGKCPQQIFCGRENGYDSKNAPSVRPTNLLVLLENKVAFDGLKFTECIGIMSSEFGACIDNFIMPSSNDNFSVQHST